jgi:hypothetical protein
VSINDTRIIFDNSVGDRDTHAGGIRYTGTLDGYRICLTTSTELTAGSLNTFTKFEISSLGGREKAHVPLVVTINQPIDMADALPRGAGFAASDVVSPVTSWVQLRGGARDATTQSMLVNAAGRGLGNEAFGPTSEEYWLSQTITLTGLRGGKKATVVAGSEVEIFEVDSSGGDDVEPVHAPAPPGLTLLAVGLALVGAYQLLPIRFRTRV